MKSIILDNTRKSQDIRNDPKIVICPRGWYITSIYILPGYLQHDGTVSDTVDNGFWPTKEAAKKFWKNWKINKLLLEKVDKNIK